MVQFRILLILPWVRASLKGFYAIGIHVPRIGSAVVKNGSVALVPLKSRGFHGATGHPGQPNTLGSNNS